MKKIIILLTTLISLNSYANSESKGLDQKVLKSMEKALCSAGNLGLDSLDENFINEVIKIGGFHREN